MAKQGQKLTDEIKEQIRSALASNNNVREIAREFKVSPSSVMKIRDENPDEFEQLRTEKKAEFVDNAWKMIGNILVEMQAKMGEATFRELSTGLGIMVDKAQLVDGEATSRSDNTNKNIHELGELTSEQAEDLIKTYMSGIK